MLGSYDFCGHYEWTFAWLKSQGQPGLLEAYWEDAIGRDSQAHARDAIVQHGLEGMKAYWGHTMNEESPDQGYTISSEGNRFRMDIHDCPSKGFLLRNNLEQFPDYCDHCIGWIGPVMREAGYAVNHEHNHRGQCWWEMFPENDGHAKAGTETIGARYDSKRLAQWDTGETPIDRFVHAHGVQDKKH